MVHCKDTYVTYNDDMQNECSFWWAKAWAHTCDGTTPCRIRTRPWQDALDWAACTHRTRVRTLCVPLLCWACHLEKEQETKKGGRSPGSWWGAGSSGSGPTHGPLAWVQRTGRRRWRSRRVRKPCCPSVSVHQATVGWWRGQKCGRAIQAGRGTSSCMSWVFSCK